ncbi:type VI secretion system baseplate subunit TssF [Escherichia coli]
MEFEERYFREELDYLRQLSKLLATEKPHLARFLAEKDADPDIERLLEGVAFLTGNLRQKIEDEFPELTHGLIKMLWPNYLRPVPAMTLIEYTPDMDKSSVPVLIPRNEQFTTNAGEIRVDEVLPSDAKKEEPPPCTFTLCRDIWLLPVRLPQLTGLLFNDHTPFISEQTKQWLAASPDAKVAPVAQIGEESKAARACFAEQGLEAALRYLDMLPEGDPRDQFHRQYLAAQLTEEAGLVQLAQQQYRMLFRMGLQMMVADWEPSLLEQLEQKFTAEQ